MRVSQQMLHQSSVRHMNQNLSRLEKTNNQVSTGKLLHRPSDDPNGVSKAMNLKSALAANEQYERNTNEATLWLDESDQTINSMVNVMQRVRELAVQGNNDTLTVEDRENIAIEVAELNDQIVQFSKTKVKGDYDLFGSDARKFTIADGVEVPVSVTKDELFIDADGNDLLQTLNQLELDLRGGQPLDLQTIDAGIEQLLNSSAQTGARQNRVESIANRIEGSNIELKSMLSKLEDIDYAEAITKLKSEESVYQASLAASAKIIQPSLMDFLR